jgi:hypothetical protein
VGTLRAPAECVIKVGASRTEITDLYPFLTEVVVEAGRTEAATATLRFETRREEEGHWTVQDSGYFAPWEPILIEAVFGDHRAEVMRGYVREITADYPAEPGATSVVVECQDESLPLDREHVRRDWGADAPTSDTAILQEIVSGRHGATVHPDSAAGQSGLVRHQDSTDIRFLRQRAQANGYELIFREGSVYFGPMRLDAEPQQTILVYAGRDTHCVRLSIKDDGHKPDRVAFDRAADTGAETVSETVEPDLPLLGNAPADSSQSGLGDFTWRMSRTMSADETELRTMAQERANAQSMRISADGELDGSMYGHVLRAAEPVGVDGVGERYGGVYYVDRVTHRFDMNGYRQTFRLLRNAYGDNLAPSSGLLAGLL